VRQSERFVDDLADAILDGSPVDWAAAEASADDAERPLVRELGLVALLAALHRDAAPPPAGAPSTVPAHQPIEAGTQWGGHLRVLESIGRGAFGEVFRAWDTRLDREVALKLLPSRSGDREASSIIREGQLLARVRHPNVVTIYGAEHIGDQVGLWMELVHGQTLEQILDHRKALSAAEAIDIALELCHAVAAVHAADLLHRDIKAHNVMRADAGRIVLMDFGAGREADDGLSSDLAGTPLYLAPEVLRGEPATVRSDIYSLGVLLYHLVTGSYPVRASTVREVRNAHDRGERTPVQAARRDLPPKLARVVERAIDPRPDRRYASAAALGADLAALKPRPPIQRAAVAAAIGVAILLVAGIGWEVVGRRVGPARTPSALLASAVGINIVGVATANPAERPIIAVLPLKNLSAEPDSEYFVDGLTDEIIRNLAVIDGLRVRSRTSSFAFKDQPRDLRSIAEQLGANLVVEGSVLRAGNRLRINAQLVQVDGDVPLWVDRFDRELDDVFAIQDEISRAIVNKLRLTLGRGQRRYDTNLDAYELYLKARALVDQRGVDNAQKAAELFAQVIAKDSAFAPAHAGLANAYAFMSVPYRGVSFDTALPIMRSAATTALKLDPLLAEAHAAIGWVWAYDHGWTNAEKAFQRAIELNPSLTQIYTSYSISTLQPLGKAEQALRFLHEAAQSDPLSLDVQREIGEVQLMAQRYDEAIETLRRVYARDRSFPFVGFYLARALAMVGRAREASSLENTGPVGTAILQARTGRLTEAKRFAEETPNPYAAAIVYAVIEDHEHALEALEQVAVSAPHRLGRLLNFPELVGLRGDPGVAALRAKIGLP
jgi:eukaryotic-like serine/threonine-protein kinase